jgi:transposase
VPRLPRYPEEFRCDVVALVRSSPVRTVAEIAREFGVNHEMLRQWVKAADRQQVHEAAGFGRAEPEEPKRLRKENAELKLEKGDSAQSGSICCRGDGSMTCRYRFISANAGRYKAKRLCRVPGVGRSGYNAWVKAGPARAAREAADARLAGQIHAAHADSRGTYGCAGSTPNSRRATSGPGRDRSTASGSSG